MRWKSPRALSGVHFQTIEEKKVDLVVTEPMAAKDWENGNGIPRGNTAPPPAGSGGRAAVRSGPERQRVRSASFATDFRKRPSQLFLTPSASWEN
jgi:hypothetical protein